MWIKRDSQWHRIAIGATVLCLGLLLVLAGANGPIGARAWRQVFVGLGGLDGEPALGSVSWLTKAFFVGVVGPFVSGCLFLLREWAE